MRQRPLCGCSNRRGYCDGHRWQTVVWPANRYCVGRSVTHFSGVRAKMSSAGAVLCFWSLFVAFLVSENPTSAEGDKGPKPCSSPNHVCTTLMRYPDGYTADEGPNCFCSETTACSSEWEENSDNTLTWQHYERGHWKVQYKFCKPVFAEMRQCEPDERAVTINTEVKTWKPYIDQARCRCPHSVGTSTLYQLSGWKREGAQWKYHYNCHKVECKYYPLGTELNKRGSECAKVYIDQYKTSDKVQEVVFLCACPEGQMCPARLRKDNKDEVDLKEDDHGVFVMKYCESNHQTENNK